MGNSPEYKISSNKITSWDEQEVATAKWNVTAVSPKDKVEFNFQAQHTWLKDFYVLGLKFVITVISALLSRTYQT